MHRPVLSADCSRRRFLSGCAACAGCAAGAGLFGHGSLKADESGGKKPKIRLVFCETTNDKPIWPNYATGSRWNGESMGSVERYDRRRMDWEIGEGTIEAYDDASGKPLWKKDRLGTSLVVAGGTVFIVNRSEPDPLEKAHNKRRDGDTAKHPPQKVIALIIADNLLVQGGAILDQENERGFIRAIHLEDGKVVWEKRFAEKLPFNGLAVDRCGILATSDDGTIICLK